MNTTEVAITVAAALVLLVALVALAIAVAGRRRLRRELAAALADLAELRARVDRMSQAPPAASPAPVVQEFVITDARPVGGGFSASASLATRSPADERSRTPAERSLDSRAFTNILVAESLIRVASLGHGLRRALSAETRNQIGFEMRREVRRSRKQRRRDLKEARRVLRQDEAA